MGPPVLRDLEEHVQGWGDRARTEAPAPPPELSQVWLQRALPAGSGGTAVAVAAAGGGWQVAVAAAAGGCAPAVGVSSAGILRGFLLPPGERSP